MGVTFERRQFANGLTVIAEIDPQAHTAACGFFVRTGARDEPAPLMGVSHFLEHMMFKGTEDLTADDINRGFDAIGARNNAFTSHDVTCFYATALPERLDETTTLLARMLRPALRTADFDTEKGVILEEIAMYQDNPFWVLYEETMSRFYARHPVGFRVLGTKETITALTREQMLDYFTRRYSPDNTTVALAGRIDLNRICDTLDRWCGPWVPTKPVRDAALPAPQAEEFTMRDALVSRGYLIGLTEAPGMEDDRRSAAGLLAQLLGGPDNSLFHWALLEPGIADEAHAGHDPHQGLGRFMLFASGAPERLDEIWGVMSAQTARLRDSITPDDVELLCNRAATAFTVGGERPSDRMHRMGLTWSQTGSYRPLEEELARLRRVTVDDLRQLCDEFPMTPRTIGRMLPA